MRAVNKITIYLHFKTDFVFYFLALKNPACSHLEQFWRHPYGQAFLIPRQKVGRKNSREKTFQFFINSRYTEAVTS
jgi:hypothetical protein